MSVIKTKTYVQEQKKKKDCKKRGKREPTARRFVMDGFSFSFSVVAVIFSRVARASNGDVTPCIRGSQKALFFVCFFFFFF
jgi:hypothetical protein